MKHATLRQLKVFESVARLLSFSRAGEELHLTQPAVSTQVKKLEDHSGMPLFEQFGKKIYLTAAGAELLEISRNIIAQFEAAESAMTQLKGVSGGKLNVAVISAGDYFFPRLLVEFVGRHKGVVLNFTVHNRDGLLSHMAANLTDLCVMVRPPQEPELDTVGEAFAPHPYVIVAAPGHALVGKKKLRWISCCASHLSCAKRAATPGNQCVKASANISKSSTSRWRSRVQKPSNRQ